MSEVKFIVRTADQTRKVEVVLSRLMTGADLIQASVENWSLPIDTDYQLENITTGKSIAPGQKLSESVVSTDDILQLQPVLVAGVHS